MNKIKEIREAKGLKQKELAHRAQISVRALQNYEYDERVPDVHIAQRIAQAIDSTIEEIWRKNTTKKGEAKCKN